MNGEYVHAVVSAFFVSLALHLTIVLPDMNVISSIVAFLLMVAFVGYVNRPDPGPGGDDVE